MAAQQVWQAQEDGLKQICGLLSEYQAPNSNQSYVLQQLQQCSQIPDFNNYLAFILCRSENQSVEVRQAAGLLLKNNLKAHYQSIAPPYQQYIKGELVSCLGASDRQLRSTVGTVISVIIQQGQEAQTWPEMLDAILRCLESNDYNQMEGALDALSKICEDVPEALDIAIPGISEKPIDIFLPRLLKFFSSPHVILRKLALSSVNRFIPYMPNALSSNIDNYLGGLFSLAQDTAPEIRKLVCNAFVQFVECKSRFLEPHIKNITEYMLQANQEKDEEVALESCEFWSAFCKAQLPPELLREFLPRLIGVLLTNMDYADDDEALLDAEVDGSLPDRDQDIKPRFQKSRVMEADGEDKDEDDEVTSSWTLRKCSAAGLDILSVTFRDEILPILMPLVQSKLSITSDSAWKERESAVLALGAIAEGCINGLLPHLAEIVKVLLPLLEDRFPLVRSITCWTLSRYSRWIVQGSILFDDVLMGLLRRILDNSKKVQEAACSAFATFEEDAAEDMLTPHLESILQHLMYAYGRYQQRNLRILYDAMGTLAYAIGYDLNEPKYMNVLMPPLISKWQQLSDSDKELFPLMECLNAIAQAVGPGFSQYGEAVFIRCVNLIRTYQIAKVDQARAGVAYDKDFIACSLDLLSGLAEGLGSGIESLVGRSDLRDLLLPCCSDESPDVRQSALALLGDLAQGCAVHLRPHVAEFLNVAAAQLSSEAKVHIPVANNACWAIGEIAVQAKQEAAPIVMTTLAVLVPLLSNIDAIPSKSMFENSSITLGRLAWACPELVAPHVEHFMQPWCRSLCMIRDDFRKEDAFRGLCSMVRLNPNGALNSLLPMFQAIGSWNEIRTAELRDEIRQVLHGYKQILNGEYWDKCISAIDPALKEKLASNYGI